MKSVVLGEVSELASLGKDLPRLYAEAESLQNNIKWDIWDWIFGPVKETYVTQVNAGLQCYPDLIYLEGQAAREAARFIQSLKELGLGEGPFLSLIGSVLSHNPVGIATSLGGLIRHGTKVSNFESSNIFNASFASLLKSYRLSEWGEAGFQLKKGRWNTSTDGRGGMVTACPNGLDLPYEWSAAKYLE